MTQSAETQSDAQEGGYYAADVATLGDRIAAAREEAGMTAKQLAKRLGVKTSTLEDWEEDRADPRANRLTTMAGMLGVSVVWLLTGEGAGVTPPARHPAQAAGHAVDAAWDQGNGLDPVPLRGCATGGHDRHGTGWL